VTRRGIALALLVLASCGPGKGTIGAMLAKKPDGRLLVHETPDGLASDKAGLQPGDELLTIEGQDVRQMDEKQIHEALSGDVGETIRVTVLRGDEVLRLTIKRTPATKRK
jgi:C-terminal processing protease CtpA/Prc